MKKTFHKNNNLGFTLVEVLFACAIMTTVILSLMLSAQKGITLSSKALRQTQASFLLEEGAEAVRSIRDNNWSTISALTVNTTYYLSYNNGTNVWTLSTTPITFIDSFFNRTVVFSDVYRDSSDDIASSGTLDPSIKKVDVKVSWHASDGSSFSFSDGTNNEKHLYFYLADIFN